MIDNLDKKIILELDKNARQSFSQIAKKIGTSKTVVSYRVNHLRKAGIIRGYYAVIDTMKLGYYNYRIYLRLKNCNLVRKTEIINAFVNDPRTWWVARTTYPWDIAIILLAKSVNEGNQHFMAVLEKFPENIAKYEVNPYIQLTHFTKDYLLESEAVRKRQAFILVGGDAVTISPLDKQILLNLSSNARIGTVELAKMLKTTPMIVKYAIQKMLKSKVILGFRVLLDYEKIGYSYYWIHMNASSESANIIKFVKSIPNTVYLDETFGGTTAEFAVHMKSEDDLQDLLDKLLERFGAIINDYNYFRVVKNEKVIYMPQEI